MTTQKASMPFPPDTKIVDPIDPIDQGIQRLRAQHRANVAAHRAAFDEEADRAWVAAEAKRKAEFVKDYHDRNFFPLKYPYAALDRAGQYRASLPYESRLEGLASVKLWQEMLYCFLARNGSRATVSEVKTWFETYLAVDGDFMIIGNRNPHERSTLATATTSTMDIVHAQGLSKVLAELLNYTSMVETQFGKVRWFGKDFDPAEY